MKENLNQNLQEQVKDVISRAFFRQVQAYDDCVEGRIADNEKNKFADSQKKRSLP